MNTKLRSGWLHLATGAGIGRCLSFLSNLLISRWLGPVDLGIYNLFTSTVQTADTISRGGSDYALNYELGANPKLVSTSYGERLLSSLSTITTYLTIFTSLLIGVWSLQSNSFLSSSMLSNNLQLYVSILVLMVAVECITSPAWEILLVSHQTSLVALRQGLFVPLRIFFSALGALLGGFLWSVIFWLLASIVQFVWLRQHLSLRWKPIKLWPIKPPDISILLRRGLPFYSVNLISSLTFYPLLLSIADSGGFADVGYLRIGQIVQQLFAFIPSTLVPVLFLRLRSLESISTQVLQIEKPLRAIWLLLLIVLLTYCLADQYIVTFLFGGQYIAAIPTSRVLLVLGLYECLSQLTVQPFLATGDTRLYCLSQNISAVVSLTLGWLLVPSIGITGYLIARLIYVIIPLFIYARSFYKYLHQPNKLLIFFAVTMLISAYIVVGMLADSFQSYRIPLVLSLASLLIASSSSDVRYLASYLSFPKKD